MAQVSWRADDQLVDRVKRAAAARGRSLNEFVTVVLDAATDPTLGGAEAEQVRERLMHAGLLAPAVRSAPRRPSRTALEAAARRAASGTSLADLVADGR